MHKLSFNYLILHCEVVFLPLLTSLRENCWVISCVLADPVAILSFWINFIVLLPFLSLTVGKRREEDLEILEELSDLLPGIWSPC